jgi:hypothetical protein
VIARGWPGVSARRVKVIQVVAEVPSLGSQALSVTEEDVPGGRTEVLTEDCGIHNAR